MAWSTRELAELAGTSLRAVRHYHEVGLLPVPERHSNGYKQYGVSHLVRLLRIKRLVDLGFSLSQIAAMGDDDHPAAALRALDAELVSPPAPGRGGGRSKPPRPSPRDRPGSGRRRRSRTRPWPGRTALHARSPLRRRSTR